MFDSALADRLAARVGGLANFEASFSWRTFQPKRRAADALSGALAAGLAGRARVEDVAGPELADRWLDLFVDKWAKYQAAGARTANPMITGPARFPVDRNRKRCDIEHKRLGEYLDFYNGAENWARRQVAIAERREVIAAAPVVAGEEFDGVRYVENAAIDRVQLAFDGKPDPEVIAELKGRAFRWAPSLGVWQRQLTPNGIRAAKAVLAFLAARG